MLHLPVDGLSTQIVKNFSARVVCLFPPMYLFIGSLIYVSMDSWIFVLYFELLLNMSLFFCFQTVLAFTIGSSFSWLPYSFGISSLWFLGIFFSGGGGNGVREVSTARCSKYILYIHRLSPLEGHIFKEYYFLLLENCTRIQDLCPSCAHCYWSVNITRLS